MASRLNPDRCFERVLAKDPSCNGSWFFAVRTTGIFCLPSCSSRPPKRENTLFFASAQEAAKAGFRSCKKCHPEDFSRGLDPVLQTLDTLRAEARRNPGNFPSVPSLVKRSGYSSSRFFELLRLHHHTTPAAFLLRARLEAAETLLTTSTEGLAEIAAEVGFTSQSHFHGAFLDRNGLTPGEFRDLDDAKEFTVQLPKGFRHDLLRRFLQRDPESALHRLDGDRLHLPLRHEGRLQLTTLELGRTSVLARCPARAARRLHPLAVRLLGLRQDPTSFENLARRRGAAGLVKHTKGLRLPQEPSAYSALLWAVIGQQINVPFACKLRNRLIRLASPEAIDGLHAHPSPLDVTRVSREALLERQFSRQKADYVLSLSRIIAAPEFRLESFEELSATAVQRRLLELKGLGPWSVNYVMMRGLGFMDCVPYGDTGVTSGLQRFFKLKSRPDVDETRRLLEPFSPFRSLATAHLWNLPQKDTP